MGELMRPIGDLDLHLFGEGTHRRLWELLGPQPLHVTTDGAVVGARVATWAPEADAVFVVGDWSGWAREPMAPIGVSGIWSTVVPAARTGHRYGFEVEVHGGDRIWLSDAMARSTEPAPGTHSRLPTSGLHEWTDDEWMATRRPSIDAREQLRRVDPGALVRHGISTWEAVAADVLADPDRRPVEVSPIAAEVRCVAPATTSLLPGLFAPIPSLGEADGLRHFVNVLHRQGVGVSVDWPPVGGLDRQEPALRRNEVRNQLMANALYWLEEFHVDALRIAAVDASPGLAKAARDTMSVVSEEFPDVLLLVD